MRACVCVCSAASAVAYIQPCCSSSFIMSLCTAVKCTWWANKQTNHARLHAGLGHCAHLQLYWYNINLLHLHYAPAAWGTGLHGPNSLSVTTPMMLQHAGEVITLWPQPMQNHPLATPTTIHCSSCLFTGWLMLVSEFVVHRTKMLHWTGLCFVIARQRLNKLMSMLNQILTQQQLRCVVLLLLITVLVTYNNFGSVMFTNC